MSYSQLGKIDEHVYGFLENQIGVYFGMLLCLNYAPFVYSSELIMFDRPIDAQCELNWLIWTIFVFECLRPRN